MSNYPDLHLYINGAWRKAAGDLPVLNPATEEVRIMDRHSLMMDR